MYNASTAFASALRSKRLYVRVTYGSSTLDADQVIGCTYNAAIGGADTVTIGGVTAASVSLTIKGRIDLLDRAISVAVGVDVDGTMQYIPLGAFSVSECQQGEDSTTVTAYDAAYYALGSNYVPTVSSDATVAAVLGDVAAQCGLTLAALPDAASTTNVSGDLTGRTCRDMVGYMAALIGCNALINRDGALALRWFTTSGVTIAADDYYSGGLSLRGTYTLACIAATVKTTMATTDEDGTTSETESTETLSAGGSGTGISIDNPYMTQGILNSVWTQIGGLGAYKAGSVSFAGGLLLEPGDLIAVSDTSGASHTIPVMALTLTLDGGCMANVSATGESATTGGSAVGGSLSGAIKQLVLDIAQIKNLSADNLTAIKAKIDNLYADNAWLKNLFAQDITATGTISGLKLRGSDIDVETLYDEKYNSRAVIKTEYTDQVWGGTEYYYTLSLGVTYLENESNLTIDYDGIAVSAPKLKITADLVSANLQSNDTYTEFDGGVVTEGKVTVAVKMGWCLVNGRIKLDGTVSDLITVLDGAKVPAPQTGISIGTTAGYWTSSYTRLMRVVVGAGGGLRIMYGAAGLYDFAISYPVGESYTGDTSTTGRAGSAIVGTATAA